MALCTNIIATLSYVDQQIFQEPGSEIKVGYLNINGLFDGNHGHYLNADKNLISLDFLVLAETKLSEDKEPNDIANLLNNWKILGRQKKAHGTDITFKQKIKV